MPAPKKFYLICFDIVDDKIRNKVAKVLEGYGDRVQKSVFECVLSKTQLNKLKKKIRMLINDGEDSVHFYRLCNRCLNEFDCLGLEHAPVRTDYAVM